MALANDPEVIIADEPVSALDVSIQAQILNLIAGLCREENLTLILISHDLSVVRHLANRIAVMYLGKVVEQGDEYEVYDNTSHPYTQALLQAVPRLEGAQGRLHSGEPRFQGVVIPAMSVRSDQNHADPSFQRFAQFKHFHGMLSKGISPQT